MLTEYFDSYAKAYKAYKSGSWCYEDGLLYRGLELLHQTTGQAIWLDHLKRMVDAQIVDGASLAGYNPSEYNIDHIKSGVALLYLHKQTGDARYLQATAPLLQQLTHHPRTKSGVYWHKLAYPWQIWLDGLHMAAPFQIGLGKVTGNDDLVRDSLIQLDTAMDETFDPATGLYAHAYDEARMQLWADKVTGHPRAYWARAMGWLAVCLVDVAELVTEEEFAPLRQRTIDLLNRIIELQQPDGLWLQVIDQPDLEGNYQEASASAMFIYALSVAGRIGLIEPRGRDDLDRLVRTKMHKRPDGQLEMIDICWVAGLGPFKNRYRDGSPEYYVSEELRPDDVKGVAPLMMCVAEAERQSPATSELSAVG